MTDQNNAADTQQDIAPTNPAQGEAEEAKSDIEQNPKRFRWNREYTGWIFGITSIVVSLLSIWYVMGSPKPTYSIPENPSIVFDSSRAESSIQVLDSDGDPIDSNVYLISVTFWNSGRDKIEPEDIRIPVRIELYPIQRILSAEVLRQTLPESTGFSVDIAQLESLDNERGYVELDWNHLDPKSGAVVQIIYQSDIPASIDITGQIYEIPSSDFVHATNELDVDRSPYQFIAFGVMFIVYILSLAIIGRLTRREHKNPIIRRIVRELFYPQMSSGISFVLGMIAFVIVIKVIERLVVVKPPI